MRPPRKFCCVCSRWKHARDVCCAENGRNSEGIMGRRKHFGLGLAGAALVVISLAGPAHAVDEIQVYNAEIAELGQWTIQQHLNYAIRGRKEPDFPGGLIANHALNGTPELAYGLTDWWELGFYAPFAVSDHQFLSNGAKIRTLF